MGGEFEAKVALVTGGNAGIGRAAAIAYGAAGASVVIGARREDEGRQTVETIRGAGGDATFVKTDVSVADQVQKLVETTVETYGGLDYAFNNAGIMGSAFVPTADFDEAVWDDVAGVNLKGVWLAMKYEIPEMLKRGGGAIVNNSSIAGLRGGRLSIAYSASKHGVLGATKAAASEYAESGIRINAVCPAVIETDMGDIFSDPQFVDRVTAMHPIGRFGKPEEVADAVLWLCSDKASFVTGHSLAVDGGFLL